MKKVFVQGTTPSRHSDEPWHTYITIDVIWHVCTYSIFHPFVSWVLVLCLRAQYTPYENIEMIIAMSWAMLVTAFALLSLISDRVAFGPPRDMQLSDEVIVITGGAEGLGGLLAETYGMRNVSVAVLDTRTVDESEAEEKGVAYYHCDVSDAEQVRVAADRIVNDLGVPTILINNAAIVHAKSILESTHTDVKQILQVNTLSHFITLQEFLPHMLREGRGTIVTITSVLGHLGAANLSAYTASKAALLALHHSLRAELAQDPRATEIKTILVTLGQMSTKMFAHVQTPSRFLAPIITPADVAKCIITMVEKGESGEIALPLYSRYIQLFSILPFGVQRLLRRWSGIDMAIGKSQLKESHSNGKDVS